MDRLILELVASEAPGMGVKRAAREALAEAGEAFTVELMQDAELTRRLINNEPARLRGGDVRLAAHRRAPDMFPQPVAPPPPPPAAVEPSEPEVIIVDDNDGTPQDAAVALPMPDSDVPAAPLPPPSPKRARAFVDDYTGVCCVCSEQSVTARFDPCGHARVCTECARRWARKQPAGGVHTCPVCRAPVERVARRTVQYSAWLVPRV